MQMQSTTAAPPMVIMDDIDDPLNIQEHLLYEEHLQHNQRALFSKLHDITLRFEDDRRYRNDTRYIRIWLKYASFFEDRSWVYEHMHHKRIGEYVGAYYEHAAEYYATHKNRWKQAEELVTQGIQKKAEPLSHLHQMLLHIRQKQFPNDSKFVTTFKGRPATNPIAAPNTPHTSYTNNASQLLQHPPFVITQGRHRHEQQQQQQQHVDQVINEDDDVDMDAIRQQQIRMETVQECYSGSEIRSFEELRAQLQHHYRRNQVKKEEADDDGKVDLRIVSHHDRRQKTSYPGIGSHSEEARQNVAPTPAETAQLYHHEQNEVDNNNTNNNIRTDHHHQPPHGDTRTTATTSSATAAHVASIPPAFLFIRTKLAHLSPPFESYAGFHGFTTLQLKRIQTGKILQLEDGMAFRIIRRIAQGGYARVYLAATISGNDNCAIKVETPANPWEFYILCQLRTRLMDIDGENGQYCYSGDTTTKTRLWRQSIIQAHGFYLYNNGSYLILEHANQGTLLDCFNAYRTQHLRSAMRETLALFLIIRLLQAVQTIHTVHIIHGDLKMDNVMMALGEQGTLPQRFDDGDEEWQNQYLVLIDFGRAVDLSLLPSNVYLKADWSPQPADPLAVRQGLAFRPRAIDYYGLANIAHWLLFGKAMSVVGKHQGNGWQIQERWKRYWHIELWQQLFELLLNPPANNNLSDMLVTKVIKMGQQILQQDKYLATRVSQLPIQSLN